MRLRIFFVLVLVFVLPLLAVSAYADTPGIGAAGVYAVLGLAGVTNTGPSVISGNVGGSIGTPAVTGFPPGIVNAPSSILTGSVTAFANATTAYLTAQGLGGILEPPFGDFGVTNLTGQTLGVGLAATLLPGIYEFNSSAQLTGALTLNAMGSPTAQWTFQIGSTLTTASASSVTVINAPAGGFTGNGGITWAVGSSATLGTTTTFLGTIISLAGDAIQTGATIGCGRVISLAASVTLDTNVIDTGCTVTAGPGGPGGPGGTITPPTSLVPEPGTFALLSVGLLAMVFLTFRKSRVSSLSPSC
jgi:ice-binding like protein/PEP-CTERM motif-containing protein